MPYTVDLPDGRSVEFPDNISKEQAASVIRKQFNFGGPETTVTGNVKEAFKGLVPGAVNLVEGAVTGASAMLPAEYEQAARAKTAEVAKTVKAPFAAAPGYEESVGRKFGEALGSTAPFFAMGPLGLAGRAAMMGTGVAAGAGEARKRAEESGATEAERSKATGFGAVVGSTESLPVFSFLNKLGKPAADALLAKVRRAAVTGGQEAAQEIVSSALQNAIAKGIYKPEQSIIEGTGEAGAYGAGVGAFIQGVTDMALGRRARQATQTRPAEAPIDVATAEQAAIDAQAPQARKVLPENNLYELASGPSGYAEVAKYKAGLLEGKQTTEVKAAIKEATALLKLMDVEEYNRALNAKKDVAKAVKERGLPTAETSAFNLPVGETTAEGVTPAVPEPTVRKKGAQDVAQPDIVEPGEVAAIEPAGAAAVVPSVGVDSEPYADAAAIQPEAAGVGVPKLPATGGNAVEGITGSTVDVKGVPYTVSAYTDSMFSMQNEKGTSLRVMRKGKLGRDIEAQLGIKPVEEVPAPEVEVPEAAAPVIEAPAAVEAPVPEVEVPEAAAVEAPTAPTTITPETLAELGINKRAGAYKKIVGKEITDPEVRKVLESYMDNNLVKSESKDKVGVYLKTLEAPVTEAPATEAPTTPNPFGALVQPLKTSEVAALAGKVGAPAKGMPSRDDRMIAEVIKQVGIYNTPSTNAQQRYRATDAIYVMATGSDISPQVKQFALRALRNAVDPVDMRPSLRGKYDAVVKDVEEDTTDWGSYKQQLGINVPLPAAEQAHVETSLDGKPLQFVADWLAGNAPSKVHREIANKVKQRMLEMQAAGVQFTFRIVKLGEMAPRALAGAGGLTVTSLAKGKVTCEVYLPSKEVNPQGMHYEVIAHELVHAVTEAALQVAQYKVADNTQAQTLLIDLRKLYNVVVNHVNTRIKAKVELSEIESTIYKNTANILQNPSELLAWGLTNKEFQNYLETVPYTAKQSVWSKFTQSIRSFLGLSDSADTALSEVLRIGEAIMDAPIQDTVAGAKQVFGTSTTPMIATPGATTAAKQADVIGVSNDPTLTENMRQLLGAKLNRSYLTDKLNSIDRKLTAGYAGRLFDALGNINPSELLAQALDATRVVERAFIEGFLTLTPDGMFTATTGKLANGDAASLKSIFDLVNKSAKQSGNTLEQERKVLSSLLVGHREFELDKHNNLSTTPVAIELRIKDDNKRNELERQFQANPDAKKVLEIMDAMRFNRIDMMVAAGRISQDKANFWKSTTGYVPFQDMEALTSMAATRKVGPSKGLSATAKYKRIEGGDQKVGDSIDSFIDLMSRMSMDVIKTNAVSKAAQALTKLGHAKRISPAVTLSGKQLNHTLDTYVNGVPARFYFNDPLDAAAFAGMPGEISTVVSAAQQFSRVLRAGVTLVPGFAVGQVLQDISRAYALSDVANPKALIPRILMNFPKAAFGELTGRKSAAITRMENMGVMATFDVSTRGTVKNILKEVGAEKRSLFENILHVGEAISKGSDIAVRKAIYEQSMKETGGNEALSMSRAREIINFSRRGNAKFIDFLVRTVPFTNAYIRGMDKLYTASTGKGNMYGMTKAEARGVFRNRILTLSSIGFAYALMMAGDEEYEALDDSVRDSRFVIPGIKLGETPVAIPLPRDLAFIFKAIPERVVNYFRKHGTEEEKSGIRVLGELLKQGGGVIAAPNVTPTAVLPLLENIANYSFFLDRALESQSQMSKESFTRYGRGTSEVSKVLSEGLGSASKALGDVGLESVGSAIEVSPVKLENLFRGLLGTSASLALAIGDELLAPERTDKPTQRSILAQITGASAIMIDPVGKRQLNAFYDLHEKISKVLSA